MNARHVRSPLSFAFACALMIGVPACSSSGPSSSATDDLAAVTDLAHAAADLGAAADLASGPDLAVAPDLAPVADLGRPKAPFCVNAADQAAIAKATGLSGDVSMCTLQNVTMGAAAISACVQMKDGLSAPCADCYGAYGMCGAQNCLAQCTGMGGAAAMACTSCIAMACGTQFTTCTGLPPS